ARRLEPLATTPAVGDLTGRVVDDETGQVLWERRPDAPRVPASTAKLLTAVAALSRLPSDKRVDTVLAEGTEPGTLVVVPGGDPTMSAGAESGPLFPGSATLTEAADVVRHGGLHPERIVVDPGPYTGPDMGPGWSPVEIAAGNLAPVQPWMLDAGRIDPAEVYSPRHAEPALAAAGRWPTNWAWTPPGWRSRATPSLPPTSWGGCTPRRSSTACARCSSTPTTCWPRRSVARWRSTGSPTARPTSPAAHGRSSTRWRTAAWTCPTSDWRTAPA